MVKIGVIGATGYTGLELLKLLARHPAVEVEWLTSENSAGQRFGDVFPVPPFLGNDVLVRVEDADISAVNVVFCCLPHVAAQGPVAAARRAGARVIDLSADFRIRDAKAYETWYGHAHTEPEALSEAVYGLPELHRAEIAHTNLVANPGCYPTSIILGLAPLAKTGWLHGAVIADSKSGVSGAGRGLSLKTHFVEANENMSPYSIGRTHRHLAEMDQELGALVGAGNGQGGGTVGGSALVRGLGQGGETPRGLGQGGETPRGLGQGGETPRGLGQGGETPPLQIVFSPHLLPVNRGILSTIYVHLPAGVSEAQARAAYADAYSLEPFVHLLKPGQVATLAHAVHTNFCALGLTFVPGTDLLIVTAAIDNLIKGASGQAVQNMNIMLGCDEKLGLI